MEISEKLKDFINENLDLIDKNTKEAWEEIYYRLQDDLVDEVMLGKFTESILLAGINDPAEILGYIPYCYLYESGIDNYIIPDAVESIDDCAFVGTRLSSIVIPDNVKEIGDLAFAGCSFLEYVSLPKTFTVSEDAMLFRSCSSLHEVEYRGSIDDYKLQGSDWIGESYIENILCTDGATSPLIIA